MKRFLNGAAMALILGVLGSSGHARPGRPAAMPPVALNYWAFVSTQNFEVYVVDMNDTSTPYGVIQTISSLPVEAFDIVYNPLTNQVVTCGQQLLQVIDPVALVAGPSFSVGGGSYITKFIEMTPDFQTYIVCASDGSQAIVYEVDAVSFAIRSQLTIPIAFEYANDMCFKPGSMFGAAGTNQVYVAYGGLNYVHKVDLGAGLNMASASVSSVSFGTDFPQRLDANRMGTKVFVSGGFSPTSTPHYFDPNSASPSPAPITGFGGFGLDDIIVRPQGDFGYFGDSMAGLMVFNAGTNALVASPPQFPPSMNGLSTSPDGAVLAAAGSNQVDYFDITNPQAPAFLGATLSLPAPSFRVAFAPVQRPVIERVAVTAGDTQPVTVRFEGRNFSPLGPPVMDIGGYSVSITQVTATSVEGNWSGALSPPLRLGVLYRNNNSVALTQTSLPGGFVFADPAAPFFGQTGITGGSAQADYRLRGFPGCIPAGAGRAALETAFGAYNPIQWRMFMWNRASQQYVEFDQLATAPTTADWTGEGFFLIARDTSFVTAPGFDPLPGAPSPMPIPIAPGWNIVTSPWDGNLMNWIDPIEVEARASSDAAPGALSPSNFGISDPMEWMSSGQYMATTTLVPGLGYWVRNPNSFTVWLFLTPGAVYSGQFILGVPDHRPLGPDDPVPPPPPGYGQGSSRVGCGLGMAVGRGSAFALMALLAVAAGTVRLVRSA